MEEMRIALPIGSDKVGNVGVVRTNLEVVPVTAASGGIERDHLAYALRKPKPCLEHLMTDRPSFAGTRYLSPPDW